MFLGFVASLNQLREAHKTLMWAYCILAYLLRSVRPEPIHRGWIVVHMDRDAQGPNMSAINSHVTQRAPQLVSAGTCSASDSVDMSPASPGRMIDGWRPNESYTIRRP